MRYNTVTVKYNRLNSLCCLVLRITIIYIEELLNGSIASP